MKKRNNELGDKIYNLRIAKNISQDDLAEKVGVSRQIVSKWETGLVQPKADKLPLICEALGVGVEVLMPPKENKEDNVINDNEVVASDVVDYDEAIENEVEKPDLPISSTKEESSDQDITRRKRKLSKKAKIAIVATLLTIVVLLGILFIVLSTIVDSPKMEGSLAEEDSVTWSNNMGNIGWTLFSVFIAIVAILSIILVCKIVKNKKNKQEKDDAKL